MKLMFQHWLHVLGQFLSTFSKLQSANLHQVFLSWHTFPFSSYPGPDTPEKGKISRNGANTRKIYLRLELLYSKLLKVKIPLVFKSWISSWIFSWISSTFWTSCSIAPSFSAFSATVLSISSMLDLRCWNSRLKFLLSLISSSIFCCKTLSLSSSGSSKIIFGYQVKSNQYSNVWINSLE